MNILNELTDDYLNDLLVRMAHHSTAIEGNSLTLGETKSILIDKFIPRAIELREFHEVANYKNYIDFLLDALKQELPVDIDLIKKTHYILCNNAIEGVPGRFKTIQNVIIGAGFETTEPYKVQEELKNWCDNLNYRIYASNSNYDNLSVICEQHINFEKIHPFSDGNGRVGRALIVYSCLQNDLAPAVIPVEQRKEYINYLNNGDVKGLTAFAAKLQINEKNRLNLFKNIASKARPKSAKHVELER